MPLNTGYAAPGNAQTERGRRFALSHIHKQTFTDQAALDVNGVLESVSGPNTETLTPALVGAFVTGGVATLPVPKPVIVTVTHASSIVACNGVITGTNFRDVVVTETWAVTATGTSKTDLTATAFKTVTGVTLIGAGDASANSIFIGDSNAFGLDMTNVGVVAIMELEDGAVPTAGVLIAASSAANVDEFGIYTPDSAPDGSLDFEIWYMVDDIQVDTAPAA